MPPLVITVFIKGWRSSRAGTSAITGFLMSLSIEPFMSHEITTSHSAIPFADKSRFLSSTVFGISAKKLSANMRQNLF